MPNIKNKPFHLTGKTCYKCNQPIEYLTFNWTYNTRRAGNFAHQDCFNSSSSSNNNNNNHSIVSEPTPPTTESVLDSDSDNELEFETDETNTYEPIDLPIIQPIDIVDKIEINSSKHEITEKVVRHLRRNALGKRAYPLLHGAPGSGKSFLANQLADDMGIEFLSIACSEDMFKSEILGSKSPINGVYFPVKFVELWTNGGVVLFDESGLANGNFLNVMNNAMANRILCFPNGETIKMHKNFFMLFADNSNLFGDDPLFPERQDAGGAFRDRLKYVRMTFDENIELQVITGLFQGDSNRASRWHKAVKRMRRAIPTDLPVFVSSRFAYGSAEDFAKGFNFDEACENNLFQGREDTDPDLIQRAIEICKASKGKY